MRDARSGSEAFGRAQPTKNDKNDNNRLQPTMSIMDIMPSWHGPWPISRQFSNPPPNRWLYQAERWRGTKTLMCLLLLTAAQLPRTAARNSWPSSPLQSAASAPLLYFYRTTALRCLPIMVSASDIRKRLGELLPTLDMDKSTEREIQGQLAEEMGDISSHTEVINTTIVAFLEKILMEEILSCKNEKHAEVEGNELQQYRRDFEVGKGIPQKFAKVTKPITSSGEYSLSLGTMKMLKVYPFKNKMVVHIRQSDTDKDQQPGKNGICLNLDEWSRLRAGLPSLRKALDEGDDSTVVNLGNMRWAYAIQYGSKWSVHIREMYEKNGDILPSRKGITLNTTLLGTLSDHSNEISSAVDPNGAHPGPTAAPPPRAPSAVAQQPTRAAPYAAASPSPSGEANVDATFLDLGGMKRASIRNFKGNLYVDLGEWYLTDGNAAPVNKGISLTLAEWQTVVAAAPAAKEAVQQGNLKYFAEIKTNLRLALNEFKGNTYIGVREFYEKDGKLLPGLKGLSMSIDLWDKLMVWAARVLSECLV
eukprot:gene14906-20955_t